MRVPVLVILGDPSLRESIAHGLRREGMEVSEAETPPSGLALARRTRPALVLLDAGYEKVPSLCRCPRDNGEPLLLLLGPGATDLEVVRALEAGVDHFLRLPCSTAELLAHVRALLRRRGGRVGPRPPELQVGDLRVTFSRREVRLAGQPIHLAAKEFDILAILAENAGRRVVSRADLLRAVWPGEQAVKSTTLDVHIFALRTKLEEDPARPRRIVTVRAVGYRLVEGEERK